MITLIPTDDPNRLNVVFRSTADAITSDETKGVVGYIECAPHNCWYPRPAKWTDDGHEIGFPNPLDAAKTLIPDYEDRMRREIVRTIEGIEQKINADQGSRMNLARHKMIDGLKARLQSGDF